MKKILCIISGLLALFISAVEAGDITVTITNKTKDDVGFFLNGGRGLETELKKGETQVYSMVVDAGKPPTMKILNATVNGQTRFFTLKNGGHYVLHLDKNGNLVSTVK
jgi:hypothetical protein